MLRQQVNLYKYYKEPLTTTNYLTWQHYCKSIFIVFTLLMTVYLIKLWHVSSLRKQDEALTTEAAKTQMQFIQLKGKLPPLFFSQDINKTLNQLASDLRLKEEVVESIVEQPHMSTALINFSELIVPDVWLTKFSINEKEDTILLSGRSLSNEALQKFMSNLSNSKSYSNYKIILENAENDVKEGKTNLRFDIQMVEQHGKS